jgi:PKD repeat protein
VGITEGDIEYRAANVTTRASLDWSGWKDVGDSDWGDAAPGPEPFIFHGEPGKAYRFRYRVRDRAQAFSDFAEPANITRINRPPVPAISAPSNGVAGQSIELSANASKDPDGDRLNYTWDFGDGSSGYGMSVNHRFSQGKRYTVTLYVDDSIENVSVQKDVVIKEAPSALISLSNFPWIYLAIVAVVAVVAVAAFLASRRKRPVAVPARRPARAAPHAEAGPVRHAKAAPPPEAEPIQAALPAPSLGQSEVEEQVTAAMDAVAELKRQGLATDRAGKILALATSSFAEGRLETASKFSQKVMKIRDELVKEAAAGGTAERAADELKAAQEDVEAVKSSGIESERLETEMDMARMYFEDKDYDRAVEHASKAGALARELKEKGQRDRAPPAEGRKKVAVKKTVKAAVLADKAPEAKTAMHCPSCGTDLEPGWKLCPVCEKPL